MVTSKSDSKRGKLLLYTLQNKLVCIFLYFLGVGKRGEEGRDGSLYVSVIFVLWSKDPIVS